MGPTVHDVVARCAAQVEGGVPRTPKLLGGQGELYSTAICAKYCIAHTAGMIVYDDDDDDDDEHDDDNMMRREKNNNNSIMVMMREPACSISSEGPGVGNDDSIDNKNNVILQ